MKNPTIKIEIGDEPVLSINFPKPIPTKPEGIATFILAVEMHEAINQLMPTIVTIAQATAQNKLLTQVRRLRQPA